MADNVVILMASGPTTVNRNNIPIAARELRDQGISVYAIGVGDKVNTEYLQDIASKPLSDHLLYLGHVNDEEAAVSGMTRRMLRDKKCVN